MKNETLQIKSKLPDVGTTIFTVMSALANEVGAINLSQGFPDFEIDPELKRQVNFALQENQVQYAPMPGRLDLREALAKKMSEQHERSISPEEITITAGATQAIFTAMSAVLEPGDEVILFDPAYDCYDPTIRLNKAVPVHLKLKFPTYKIDWDEVESTINNKTRMIVVNNPQNPTGAVWDQSDLLRLEKIVLEHPSILIISDEVYEHIQFGSEHQSVLKSELLSTRSFVTYSFGKTFHVTGWKLGYVVAPELLTNEFRKVHQFNVFCANNTMQYAIAKYLENGADLNLIAPFYQEKRDFLINALKDARLKPLTCNGTYFGLFDYSNISDENDVDFAKRITKEFGVATIPVSVFYKDLTDHKVIRICFAKTEETLKKGAEKLCQI